MAKNREYGNRGTGYTERKEKKTETRESKHREKKHTMNSKEIERTLIRRERKHN